MHDLRGDSPVVSRVVSGARYGLRDWLAQRITGAIVAVYALCAVVMLTIYPVTYSGWKGLFSEGWFRVASLLFAASFGWHIWIGMRDVLMDYVKAAGVRLLLEVAVILIVASYLGWTIQILWR
jgi:succinate dehydrogenase / fumarate reductase membrane anchor subunit